MRLENQIIFIVSNEGWGNTWYSKHNYAWELAKKNIVYFIDPPKKFRLFNLFRKNIEEKKITENLSVLKYNNILPVRFELFRKLNEALIFNKLFRFLKERNLTGLIFWTFDPIRLSSPELLKPKKVILHMVDKYRFTYPAEQIISKKADILICVSNEIAEGYYHLNKNVHVIPHAIATEEFMSMESTCINRTNEKKIGVYVGNIDLRMDFEITKYIIKRFPEIEFHYVGQTIEEHFIKKSLDLFSGKYQNVIYHGEKPFKELKKYITMADFCFLFKDVNFPGNNISSHKMLQYFALGKLIFCTQLSKYIEVDDLLVMKQNKVEIGNAIEKFIQNNEEPDLKLRRIEYAKRHSFERILQNIEEILDGKKG